MGVRSYMAGWNSRDSFVARGYEDCEFVGDEEVFCGN